MTGIRACLLILLVALAASARAEIAIDTAYEDLAVRLLHFEAETTGAGTNGRDDGLVALLSERQHHALSAADEQRFIEALQAAGLLQLAADVLNESQRSYPELRLRQAQLWLARGRPEAALGIMAQIETVPPADEIDRQRAEIAIALGQVEEGRQWLSRLSSPTAYDDYRLAHLWQDERPDETTRRLVDVLRRRDAPSPLLERVRLELAMLEATHGHHAAMPALLEAISGESAEAEAAIYLLGRAHWALGHKRQAIRLWDRLAGTLPVQRAIAEAQLALPFGLARIGAIDEAIGRYRDAKAGFERAMAIIDAALADIDTDGLPAGFPLDPADDRGLVSLASAPFLIDLLASNHFIEKRHLCIGIASAMARAGVVGVATLERDLETLRSRCQHELGDEIRMRLVAQRQQLARGLDDIRFGLARLLDERSQTPQP